ncbi:MAG: HXXEE domain-containing protein [Lewinellaceae bacterium]|nr:HXXEE domain-containing protein [Lewinellaceae bacterium]
MRSFFTVKGRLNWFADNWPYIGGFLALLIFINLLVEDADWVSLRTLLLIHLGLLFLHQVEEYKIPGGFKTFFNQHILRKNPIMKAPLTDAGIVIVNVLFGWTAYAAAAYWNERAVGFALGLLFITGINGLAHTAMGIILRKYNPGLITGLFLFIPFAAFMIFYLSAQLSNQDWTTGIVIGVVGTAMIPFGIWLTSSVYAE